METVIRKANPHEAEKVKTFYYNLIDDMHQSPYHPKWQKGIYPDDEYIRLSVENGEMYIALTDEEISGAMILNSHTTEGYERITWSVEAKENEVAVIHALGVTPRLSRRGIAKQMVLEAADISKKAGRKAIRLDVLYDNIPALKLYEGLGFSFRGRIKLFYEDTGECDFDIYELVL